MPYERGDVVLLEFPFSDGSTFKKRPCVVIACAAYLATTSDLIVCAVTSQLKAQRFPGATLVEHWQAAGLPKPSVVKPVIHTVDRALVSRRLGRLTAEDLLRVDESLRSLLF